MRYVSGCAIAILTLRVASTSLAAEVDDVRVNQLEQEVLSLKQQVSQQARRIENLESAAPRNGNLRATVIERSVPKNDEAPRTWLEGANWDKLKIGMIESEVLRILGPPTTSRENKGGADSKTLFYAMELGAGGFLSGRVVVADRRITEIHKPALR